MLFSSDLFMVLRTSYLTIPMASHQLCGQCVVLRETAPKEPLRSILEENRLPILRPHLRSVVDRDGAVILDIERDSMLTINSTGSYVWERLKQGKQIDEIICELASETGADPITVDLDVRAFLDELKSRHLLIA
jgi:hypothetical protein